MQLTLWGAVRSRTMVRRPSSWTCATTRCGPQPVRRVRELPCIPGACVGCKRPEAALPAPCQHYHLCPRLPCRRAAWCAQGWTSHASGSRAPARCSTSRCVPVAESPCCQRVWGCLPGGWRHRWQPQHPWWGQGASRGSHLQMCRAEFGVAGPGLIAGLMLALCCAAGQGGPHTRAHRHAGAAPGPGRELCFCL